MTPQTSSFIAAADLSLAHAHTVLTVNIANQAARLAYYGQFHAAQALIFERTGKVAKTHRGVSTQFHKLAAADPTLSPDLAGQLSKAYRYKEIADYETGDDAFVEPAEARAAIAMAERFVAAIREALAAPPETATA